MRTQLPSLCGRMALPFAALAFSGLAVPVALADDPPPITVPTPTVTVPKPDPVPVAKPTPRPQPQTRPAAPPAATPSRPVNRTSTPARATVAPRHPQKKHQKTKTKAKAKPATQKPSKQQGVKGAEKTQSGATAPVASPTTSSSMKWLRTALLVALASILGVIAILFVSAGSPRTATSPARRRRLAAAGLRSRRTRPREVGVEVIQPKALRGGPIPLPPVQPREPPPAEEATPGPQEELPSGQLLADIAPPVAKPPAGEPVIYTGAPHTEEHPEVGLQPKPVRARPPFHEPAFDRPTARQEPLVEEETAVLSPGADADEASATQPTEEICAIGIWRGYVKSRFYAALMGGEEEGIEYALAESQPIRVRGNGIPDRTPAAESAHQALATYLIESGWEVDPSANGDSWYALRFRRATAPAGSNSA